jgi:glyoxylase-like metal-dependent hydrolase (beta-lactamase superfamily II)
MIKRSQFGSRVSVLSILLPILFFSGCNSKETNLNQNESRKIESLIKIHDVNYRTIIIKFGYDAITAVKTNEGIVIIDAGISTSLTNRYKRLIEKRFHQKNFIYVINSHGHHDHIRGNSIFPDAHIIGHMNCKNDAPDMETNTDSLLMRIGRIVDEYDQQLHQSNPNTHEWEESFTQKIRYASEYLDISKKVPLKLPDTTFPDSMNLKCGDTEFEMIYFGKFHSNSDILIYAPEIKTLFIGDLFSKYGRPGRDNSLIADVDNWLLALNWLKKRTNNIGIIIDGHGQILSVDDLNLFTDNLLLRYSK